MNMAWLPYQPLGKETPLINGDCLIRAISKWRFSQLAPFESWTSGIYFAANMSLEEHIFPANKTHCILNYFRNHNCKVKHVTSRRTVSSIAKANQEPIMILTKDHIVFGVGGNFYDSWDSSRTVVKHIIFLKDYSEVREVEFEDWENANKSIDIRGMMD